jgi:hypothetical protein
MKKYDAILCVDPMINEADERVMARKSPNASFKSMSNRPYDVDDPRLYNQFSFGNTLKNSLSNMGNGYSAHITDFKKWVVVEVSHHNTITGLSASKTFLIVFKEKGDGMVLSTHNKYRSISGADQAISYIKASCNSLQNYTQNRL